MNFKPILFSTPMVQAILAGRKTMTRRIIKKKYSNTDIEWRKDKYGTQLVEMQNDVPPPTVNEDGSVTHRLRSYSILKPTYNVGDIMWVRETFYAFGWWTQEGKTKSGKLKKRFVDFTTIDMDGEYGYETDEVKKTIITGQPIHEMGWYKRPSLFMPKEAARIFLKDTGVKAELLHEISNEDSYKEGIEWKIKYPEEYPDVRYYRDYLFKDRFAAGLMFEAKHSFRTLWESINGRESWKANPWVWAYSFEPIKKPKNFLL